MQGYSGCAVIVSHDQRFSRTPVTDVLDVDYGTVAFLPRALRSLPVREARRAERVRDANTLAAIEHKGLCRALANTKATQAQSRLRDRVEEGLDELPESSRRAPRFAFAIAKESGKDVLEVRGRQELRRQARAARRVPAGAQGRARRHRGRQRPRQVDAAQILAGRFPATAPCAMGPRDAGRLLRTDHKELLTDLNDTPLAFCGAPPATRARRGCAAARQDVVQEGRRREERGGAVVARPRAGCCRRWRSSARTCCCSMSRPTTSISRPSTLVEARMPTQVPSVRVPRSRWSAISPPASSRSRRASPTSRQLGRLPGRPVATTTRRQRGRPQGVPQRRLRR